MIYRYNGKINTQGRGFTTVAHDWRNKMVLDLINALTKKLKRRLKQILVKIS